MKKWFVAAYLAALICASAQTYEQKIASAMERVDRVAAKGPFNPDWKSLESYQAPKWYRICLPRFLTGQTLAKRVA
jgi:hypothetical protein